MTRDEAMKEAASLFRWVASGCSVPTLGDLPRLYKDVQHMRNVADILDPLPPEPQTVLTKRERPCEVVPDGMRVFACDDCVPEAFCYLPGEKPGLDWDNYALIAIAASDGDRT